MLRLVDHFDIFHILLQELVDQALSLNLEVQRFRGVEDHRHPRHDVRLQRNSEPNDQYVREHFQRILWTNLPIPNRAHRHNRPVTRRNVPFKPRLIFLPRSPEPILLIL